MDCETVLPDKTLPPLICDEADCNYYRYPVRNTPHTLIPYTLYLIPYIPCPLLLQIYYFNIRMFGSIKNKKAVVYFWVGNKA